MALYLALRALFGDRLWWLALLNDFAALLFLPLGLLLPLAAWVRARGLVAGTGALALLALGWFGPYFLPAPQAPVQGTPVKVVTFNVWGHNAHLEAVEAWLLAQDADLVVLQEVPPRYADEGVPALRRRYPHQFSQPTDERLWGNVLLSQHPIRTVERLPGPGVPARHRFVVEIDGRPLAVYSAHIAMPIGEPRLPRLTGGLPFPLQIAGRYDAAARIAEVDRLLERVEREPYPFVVAGDFNLSEQSATYGRLAARLGDAFRHAGSGWGGSWPVPVIDELPRWVPPLLRVDYIWHGPQLRAVEARRGPVLGSDHRPFYAILDLDTASGE
jgi:endonuclease/exonuclease/phosphatase (EEP) superfamily protein YafD